MNKFKNFMYNFVQGRNGIDDLYKFLFVLFIIVWILNIFINNPFLYLFGLVVAVFMIYRAFSKNLVKRQKENACYVKIKNKVVNGFKLFKKKWNDRKTHIYRKCPNCNAELRLPKQKGKHVCTCPRCKKDFDVKC